MKFTEEHEWLRADGDVFVVGAESGKVRALVDDKGRQLKEAGPSTPVEVLVDGDATHAGLKQIVAETGTVSGNLLKSEPYLRQLAGRLPNDFKKLSNLGSYGAWLQIYFCRIRLLLSGPDGKQYFFTSNDVMGDTTKAGGRCAAT